MKDSGLCWVLCKYWGGGGGGGGGGGEREGSGEGREKGSGEGRGKGRGEGRGGEGEGEEEGRGMCKRAAQTSTPWLTMEKFHTLPSLMYWSQCYCTGKQNLHMLPFMDVCLIE